MATHIRISGIDIVRLKQSLIITDTLANRSTASFVVVDEPGTATYARGQPVEIFESLAIPPFIHPLFSGYIDTPKRKRISPADSTLLWPIQCIDNHYLADKRIAAEAYTGQTAGAIVTDLHSKYLVAEGVTIGTIDAGPTIAETIINYRSVSDAMDALAKRSDKIWYIDKNKDLYFVDRSTTPAPFAITPDDIIKERNVLSELAETSPLYRNRQYIRAGQSVTILQTGNQTGDGQTVAFAMGYPLAKEPEVLKTPPGLPLQTVGIKGIDDVKEVYWSKGDPIITFAVAPGIGDAIVVQYYGLYDLIVLRDDVAKQLARQAIEGGTGIIEAIDDDPTVDDKDDAQDVALAYLDYYGVIGKQFSFPIRQWGLEPGQLVSVTHTPYGLSAAEMLIESVIISEFAPNELRYTIKAIEGPELGDWTGFFKGLADIESTIMDRLTVGTDQILILLTNVSEIWEWSETVNEIIYACPVCDVTLLCGPTVVVC